MILFQLLKRLDRIIEWLAIIVLTLFLFAMITLSFLGMVFRWKAITCLWIDPVVRHMVLATAFLGGVVAAGRGEHLGVDLLSKYVRNERLRRLIERPLHLVTIGTLLWVTYGSFHFVQDTFLYEGEAMLGIHSGYLVAIIPLGLLLIAYRFFFLFIKGFIER